MVLLIVDRLKYLYVYVLIYSIHFFYTLVYKSFYFSTRHNNKKLCF